MTPNTFDSFRFVGYPVRVHAGADAITMLDGEVDRLGAKRVLVVCGQSVAEKTDLVDRVKAALGERVAGVFSGGKTGSPVTSVLKGVAAAREVDADGIVAVGGGSAVVTGEVSPSCWPRRAPPGNCAPNIPRASPRSALV